MILLNKLMHDKVLTELGPMQASRVIFLTKRAIYSLINCSKNEPEFEQEVARLLIKVYRYTIRINFRERLYYETIMNLIEKNRLPS